MWYLVDDPGPLGTARRVAPGALSLIGEPVTFAVHPEDYEATSSVATASASSTCALASELQARYAAGGAGRARRLDVRPLRRIRSPARVTTMSPTPWRTSVGPRK